jgi:glycosyltransferase involved in cell wall biosynthesis
MTSPNKTSKHIVMLLTNPFRPDPRVHKEARTLAHAGYRVSVLCWDRNGEFPEFEQVEGIDIHRFHIQSAYSAGSRQTMYLPRFWRRAYQEISRLAPDIVHCHDLDTTIPGYLYAGSHRIPWIYDAHECYPEQIKPQVHPVIYKFLLWLEKFISPRATKLITVGELLAERFRSFGAQTAVIGNYPELAAYQTLPHSVTRRDIGIPESNLIVAYIGGFTRAREILPLIKSSSLVRDITFLLAGDGPQRPAIESALPGFPNMRYLGWIPQEQVPAYTSLADVLYYGLNPSDGNNRYSAPNALFNAMAAGKPILTTDIGEIAHIVKAVGCGLVIPQASPEDITSALDQLKEAALRKDMAIKAKAASNSTYNWERAQEKLLHIYQRLT